MFPKAVLFLLVLLGFFSGCCRLKPVPQTGSAFSLSPDSWDFGAVKSGAVLEHEFVFRNDSRRSVNIHGADTSCSCAVSRIEKDRLQPGESSKVRVTFKTEGYKGKTEQFVYVNSDDPDNPVRRFTVKANIE
jgi:hypothetical protein